MMWVGFEESVDRIVLEREAERRNTSVAKLRKEIASTVPKPEEATLRTFYEHNKERMKASFEKIKPILEQQLMEEQQRRLVQQQIAVLRETSEVRFTFKVPHMPRFPVKAGNAPSTGPKGAPVTLIEFSDFECPYCAKAQRVIKQLLALYPDTLRVVYRDFPLSQHSRARPAAEAAQCAREQDRFWEYHDALFGGQEALEESDLRQYAGDVGLNIERFERCLTSERPKQAVLAHEEAGKHFGVQGTPAIFINGIKLIGVLPLPLMQSLIDNELEKL